MNKIILFVIVLILGSVISKSMVAIPNEKVTDITFECTIKSIQHCGTKNEVCLENYMKECQQHTVTETSTETTTTETTINVSHHVDHKKHHAYKTSIIVKEDEEEETNRICITDTNCNCEEQAKEVCSRRREENCVAKQTEACQTRCRNSRRCYQMDCSDAGKTRCDRDIQLECALKHPESTEDRISCVQKKLSCCQRYEKATCKRALRVYKFRTACEEESKTKCSAIVDEEEKCNCITKTRHSCLVNKVEKYRQSIRQVFNCEESASMICSEKKCGTEYDLCVKREKSICEPVCEKESRVACNNQVNGVCYEQAYKKCVHKWRRTYCEKRAEFKCGEDDDCLRAEKHICKRDVPSCMTGEVSCDDKNKCTEDICDPTKGCINKPINCDDNNACTTESCDPLLGCVYRTKKCDDGKLCTKDSCNPRTGECKFVYDNTICHVCQNGYCEKDQDCAAWEKSAKLEESCQKAVCDAQYGSCQAVHVKGCANKCRKSCQPYHACDTATCVLNKVTSEYECVHTEKKCDDHKSCTIDSCDLKLGCVHKLNKEVCPPNPICENDSECASWETSNNLKNKCQKAVCDKHKGICLAVSTSQECDESVCKKTCQPRHACETVQCQKNKDGKYQCAKQPVICDDKKECTVDTCDEKVGCVFKYKADDNKCKPNCQCEHNADCKQYELTEKLVDRCLKAVCDPKLGACVTEPIDKNCDRELKECQLKCKSSSKCIESVCVKDEGNRYVCQPTSRKCDDGIECTVDSCDENLGCVHKYKADDVKCPTGGECKRDAECITWGFTQKLGQQCKRPVCDLKTGACKAVPKEKPCTTVTQCQLNCKAQNPCETATCVLNTEGDFTCKRVSKLCPGSEDPCNIPSCDIATGNCVITRIQSDKCNKCTKQSDCEALNKKVAQDCNSAVCDPATQTCKVLPLTDKKCVDEKVCKKTCVASNNCEVASCVYDETTKKHTCKKTPSSEKSCLPLTQCELNCKPASLCESASCSKQTDGTYTCLRSVNTCNDNKSCTKDSCDVATGKCVNTYVVSDKCPPNAQCEKNLDCVKWASQQELDICLTPVCDTQTGACKAVSNKLKCSSKTCDLKCPPRNKCEESTCAYDSNNKLVCEYKRKSCDDKNRCTIDSCDENKGCVNTFDVTIPGCNTPRCETPKDCVKYAQDNKLADDCKDAICDSETKTCRAVLINNVKCNPYLNKCRRDCAPRDACETAECIVDASTKAYTCLRKPITCNDNNACTVDVCDKVKGCKYTYTISERCEQYCEDNNDCVNYGLKKQASLSCQVPYCDKKTTSCRLQEDPNKNCKKIENKCEKDCKPKDACHTSRCVRKGDNEFTCVQEKITCDDGQTCTEDSCDVSKGCQFRFKESATCRRPCKVDIDCDSWAITEKLADKCEKARCSRKLGSCVAVKGLQSEKCKTTDICKLNNDCPQGKFGTVCCKEGGLNKCCDNECEVDSDCVPKDKKKEWGYCRVRDSGKRECEFKPKCTGNEGCDDKNPCTKDICLTEYGFCKNIRRCVDNSECTLDICEPGKDGKTYTCKNPTKSCTNDKTLLDKDFNLLTPEQKTKWLGKCSHLEGCVSCVVNAQCDDNNGCTKDSCVNQFCVSTPIDNKWCDPKLKGQAITVQGYFPKFTRL